MQLDVMNLMKSEMRFLFILMLTVDMISDMK